MRAITEMEERRMARGREKGGEEQREEKRGRESERERVKEYSLHHYHRPL